MDQFSRRLYAIHEDGKHHVPSLQLLVNQLMCTIPIFLTIGDRYPFRGATPKYEVAMGNSHIQLPRIDQLHEYDFLPKCPRVRRRNGCADRYSYF